MKPLFVITVVSILALILFAVILQQIKDQAEVPREPEIFGRTENTYFAEIDKDGVVLRVIVATEEFIQSGSVGDPKRWIQTDKKGLIRKNPASIGARYDKLSDSFIPPKPYPSWVLDDTTKKWVSPVPEPKGASVKNRAIFWNEDIQQWEDKGEKPSASL